MYLTIWCPFLFVGKLFRSCFGNTFTKIIARFSGKGAVYLTIWGLFFCSSPNPTPLPAGLKSCPNPPYPWVKWGGVGSWGKGGRGLLGGGERV